MNFAGAAIGDHARLQLLRRAIGEEELRAILARPEKVAAVRPGRVVVQGRLHRPAKGVYLLRAFIDEDCDPPVVVPVYVTSKLAKYGAGS